MKKTELKDGMKLTNLLGDVATVRGSKLDVVTRAGEQFEMDLEEFNSDMERINDREDFEDLLDFDLLG